MPLSEREARDRLSDSSLRVTAPRLAVLQLLASSERPLSHTEVVDELSGSVWDQATLYRNLIKLSEAGLIQVVSELSGVRRYEYVSGDSRAAQAHSHAHFVCNSCGTVSCLPESTISASDLGLSALGAEWKGALSGASIHVMGVCPPCQTAS